MERKPQGRIQGLKFNASDFVEMISVVGRDIADEEIL
jgi:hypothetical protein